MFDPTSSKTIGYHLFFEPLGTLAEEVSVIIQRLAKEYGGPIFTPHVTLLARIPTDNEDVVIKKASEFAEHTSPFTLTLEKFEAEDAYFRALYIRIKEQDKMLELHKKVSSIFSMDESSAYKAHMSLLYGNYPTEMKESIISSLRMPRTSDLLVESVHLYRTEGETSEWYRVQEFKLRK